MKYEFFVYAAYFLNPAFQYKYDMTAHQEIREGLMRVIERLEPDMNRAAKAENEVLFVVNILSKDY